MMMMENGTNAKHMSKWNISSSDHMGKLYSYITLRFLNTTGSNYVGQCRPELFSTSKKLDCPNGWVYDDSLFTSTAVMDLDMVCKNDWMKSLAGVSIDKGTIDGKEINILFYILTEYVHGWNADWKFYIRLNF